MSYTINRYNGTTLVPGGLPDGSIDIAHTSLTLIGKDYAGYGQFLNENFVYLLENFSGTDSPSNPLTGQLWWDTANNILRVWSGTTWKISTGATSAPAGSPPGDLSSLGGDLWFDTTNQQLKVYSGSQWIVVGPSAQSALQTTGPFAATITDSSSASHKVIQLQFNGVTYAMFAYENFTTTLPGFATIRAGLNFNTTNSPAWGLSNQDVNATPSTIVQRDGTGAINATGVTAGTINATTISASSTINGTFTGNVTGNVNSTSITASTVAAQGITATSGFTGPILTASQPAITSLGNLTTLSVGTGGGSPTGITKLYGSAFINDIAIATQGGPAGFSSLVNTPISGSTGSFTSANVSVALTPASGANLSINLGAANGGWWNTTYSNVVQAFSGVYAGAYYFANGTPFTTSTYSNANVAAYLLNGVTTGTIIPSSNLAVNLGSTSSWFNNIYGTAIHAQYADLAERFHADAEYPAGTVVEMGGKFEITRVVEECSERVFGVISTNAAYLMNSGAGTDATHPAVAMSGRVPVRVVGMIAKGDRLVSAGNGMARTGLRSELTPFNVIGRALENKTDASEGIIEAIVKLNS